MNALSRLLAQTGMLVAVAAVILGLSVAPAAAFISPEMPGRLHQEGPGRPSPDEPIETQIEPAIEEINREGQDALEELGELDTPEKVQRAEEILQRIAVISYEIRKRAHDSAADRFDELNDLAIGRLGDEARAELSEVGGADSPEKRDRAEAIRARHAAKRAQLEARWENQRQRIAQRRSEQELPRADFRQPNGRPPLFAAALGLRLRLENLTQEQANEAIDRLERDGQAAWEGLGELDTPGKVQRARKMRATLAERLQDLRQRVASQSREAAGGPGNTQEMDHADEAFQERLDRETQSLQRRIDAALEELGELDTPERQEQARRIRVRLAEKVQKLREQLARHSGAASDAEFDQESDGLHMDTVVALQELGRLDTPEKVREARLIRVRMQEAINRLKDQRAQQPGDNKSDPRSDALTDRMDGNTPAELRDRAEPDRQAQEKARDALRQQRDQQRQIDARIEAAQERARARTRDRQAITPNPDRSRPEVKREVRPTATPEPGREDAPTVTPEPRVAEPVGNGSTPDADSSGSEGGRDQ